MADRKAKLPLGNLVSELRRFESQRCLPEGLSPTDEGRLDGWFYHPQIGLITSGGGRGATNTDPPRLLWPEILATIEKWLEDQP